jgi:hypothetical protein
MVEVFAFSAPDVADDEHVIRRLGWAVVRQWASLPKEVQGLIRQQAVFVRDPLAKVHVQLDETIAGFIRKHSK